MSYRLRLPLNFDTQGDELNLLCVYSILHIYSQNISAVEQELKDQFDNIIVSGVLSAHIGGEKWSAGYLRSLGKKHLSSLFRIPLNVVESIPIPNLPAVSREVSHPSPFAPLLGEIETLLNNVGKELQKAEKVDFAQLLGFLSSSSKTAEIVEFQSFEQFHSLISTTLPSLCDPERSDYRIHLLADILNSKYPDKFPFHGELFYPQPQTVTFLRNARLVTSDLGTEPSPHDVFALISSLRDIVVDNFKQEKAASSLVDEKEKKALSALSEEQIDNYSITKCLDYLAYHSSK
ncbi:hypothetical protein BLNAU_11614 [Blattamonas nauphoetae]|uniref:Uncharacterized protein n=1 Tax=Blattamonas nauphoetae TaxID=2049346 RepID=A0ABQ9XP04_9EUKA|nr:hypothetical protein BLNAU_11614 [Blattamonas nauphoetae]